MNFRSRQKNALKIAERKIELVQSSSDKKEYRKQIFNVLFESVSKTFFGIEMPIEEAKNFFKSKEFKEKVGFVLFNLFKFIISNKKQSNNV